MGWSGNGKGKGSKQQNGGGSGSDARSGWFRNAGNWWGNSQSNGIGALVDSREEQKKVNRQTSKSVLKIVQKKIGTFAKKIGKKSKKSLPITKALRPL